MLSRMKTGTVMLSLLLAVSALAETFVRPHPDRSRQRVHRNLTYRGELTFDLYRPATDAVVPVVIFVNIAGGPYATWPIYIGWAEAVADAGLGAVLYQAAEDQGTEHFDALMDSLRQRASILKIDPSRVVVWSGSSNVQLGLPLAMDRQRAYIRGAVVFYGYAPVSEIRTDLPLFYVRSGLDSTNLNQELDAVTARAMAANAPWTIENYAAGRHGFEVLDDNEVSREVIGRTIAFMKSVTRPEVSRAYSSLADDASLGAAFARGEWPAVVAGYRKRVSANPKDAESHRRLGLALSAMEQYAEALAAFEAAFQNGRSGIRDTVYPAAKAAAGAGNVDRMLYWLEKALGSRFGPTVEEIRTSEAFAAVRKDPRLEELLTRIEGSR